MYSEQSPSTLELLLDFVWSPFRTIKYFYRDLTEIDERLRDDSILVRLLTILAMPFRMFGGFLSMMVQNWPTSRSGFAAIAAIPAFFTLIGLLGAWVFVDKFRNDSWRVATNQSYYELNVLNHPETPESALTYAQKLVEIDPNDPKLKLQLGLAEARAGNAFAASDAIESIAPDDPQEDEVGPLEAHIWRARNLVRNKTAEEIGEVIDQAVGHLNVVIDADKDSLIGKSELALLYMRYANLLDEQSPERLEYLLKADKNFREIIADESVSRVNRSIQIRTLSASVLVRKQLEAIDPENYSAESEIARVRSSITGFLKSANRYKDQQIALWLILINSASEIRQFDFAVQIADQGLKIVESPEAKKQLASAKSATLRKAALSINNFDNFASYRDRFINLCEAAKASPSENSNYLLLLQYVGKENPKPSIQLTRQLGLPSRGDPVPIKPKWLYRICLDAEYTGLVNSLIGLQEFHSGDNATAIKNWNVAQQFDTSTREFIAKLLEILLSRQDKLDHLDTIFTEALLVYPEALRLRMLRGLYYTREENFQAAIDDFRVVLENKPGELSLHKRIKFCYQNMGQRRAAADEQKIIDIKLQSMPEEVRLKMLERLGKMESRQAEAP